MNKNKVNKSYCWITWDDNKNGYTQGLDVVQRARSHRLKVKQLIRNKHGWQTVYLTLIQKKKQFNDEAKFVKTTQTTSLRIISLQTAWHNAGVWFYTPQEPCGRLVAFSSEAGRRTAPPGCQRSIIQRGNGNPASVASFRRTTNDKTTLRVQRTEAEN